MCQPPSIAKNLTCSYFRAAQNFIVENQAPESASENGILRRRGEFLAYHDERRNLTFSGDKGEIDLLESKIGKLITVTLEVIPDSHELTLTLLLPKINLEGQESSFVTLAIRTKHLTSIGGPALVKGPLQTYDVLSLRGIASQAD